MSKPTEDEGTDNGASAPRSGNVNRPTTPVPLAIRSSAAFLHHLHTDPSSHHITLSATVSREGIPGGNEPHRSSSSGMERTASGKSVTGGPSRSSPLRGASVPLPGQEHESGVAGPSRGQMSRTGSRQSALGISASDSRMLGAVGSRPSGQQESQSRVSSAEMDTTRSEEEYGDPSTVESLPQLPAEGDDGGFDLSCMMDFTREEAEAGIPEAMDMLSLLDSGQSPEPQTSPDTTRRPSLAVGQDIPSSSRQGSTASSLSSGSRSNLIGRAGTLGTSAASTSAIPRTTSSPVERLDWRTFSKSYAHGLFDPNKIPTAPNTVMESIKGSQSSAHSSPGRPFAPVKQRFGSGSDVPTTTSYSTGSSLGATVSNPSGSSPATTVFSSTPSSAGSVPSANQANPPADKRSMAPALAERKRAFEFESLPRFSAQEAESSSGKSMRPDKLALPSYNFAAATVRMASSNLKPSDLAPLGVPSPERELVDPMASIISPDPPTAKSSASSDPGSSRYHLSRSMSSAHNMGGDHASLLPTIAASPVGTPGEGPTHSRVKSTETGALSRDSDHHAVRAGQPPHRIPAASVPLEKTTKRMETETDYFGTIESPPHFDRHQSYQSGSSSSKTGTTVTATPNIQGKSRSAEQQTASLPESPLALPPVPAPSEVGRLYEELGWLPAPLPPQELARRKALYRYNILHTSPDANFDRIAHMTKLVFSAKIVLIALIDAETQSHKAAAGTNTGQTDRVKSFCSHAILAKSGEPFVVLDTHEDWRFAKNPQVVGPPYIRFYAGAPLQTSDGYNIGSLCIVDDKPRTEFTPRSRLILKEFASITMREMELWRDKLQLRIRDRIQNSMEKFTRECLEIDESTATTNANAATKMDQVYTSAAQLICSTLDLDVAFILDIGEFEMMELTLPGGKTTIYRADPYVSEDQSPVLERSEAFGPVNALPVFASMPKKIPTRPLTSVEHEKLSEFLRDHKDGRIYENIAPSWIRYMFPQDLRFGLLVPIYGVDHQPFALLGAFTSNKARTSLEGYELQFLRAIGVIILSAVLRRRMVLADKAKSILISSVSHELRTPLHGILAAAELLGDTQLDANQVSFLKTVQTCGNSLIETVNHVLDFTKLSGGTHGSSSGSIKLSRVNLAMLVEQTVEGCWIGQRARNFHGDSEIGSYYAPDAPSGLIPRSQRATMADNLAQVETVIDIAYREKGWLVKCEKGGLRRVIMNLVGNSLKFTTDGYIQVTLRELPHAPGARKIPIEIAVIDTGKGIGKEFLKDQLFHPFSQENPLQTGTGLGLAIVNSIVRSENVNGKVDVWSSEGMGTEIRVSFEAEVIEEDEDSSSVSSAVSQASYPGRGHSLSFFSFDEDYRGQMLALEVLGAYAAAAGFELKDQAAGEVYVIHRDEEILERLQNSGRPIIFITPGKTVLATTIRETMHKAGGSLQILYKPVGPAAFRKALAFAVDHMEEASPGSTRHEPLSPLPIGLIPDPVDRPSISRGSSGASQESNSTISELHSHKSKKSTDRTPLLRRRSEEAEARAHISAKSNRPPLHPRGVTYHHPPLPSSLHHHHQSPKKSDGSGYENSPSVTSSNSPQPSSPNSQFSTISLADGGVMLKAAAVPSTAPRRERIPRVLIIEDNVINRRVLAAFLKKKGIEFREAIDGRAGVELFENTPPNHWDVILMDISMPVMNGHEATRAIRKIEAERRRTSASTGSAASTPGTENPPTVGGSTSLVPPVPSGSASSGGSSSGASGTGRGSISGSEAGGMVKLPPAKILQSRAKIFALTGLATSDDKREAFGSGVDGYLVKPVSLKSLGLIFQKIGFPIDA